MSKTFGGQHIAEPSCVICDDQGCEFCPGVFTNPILRDALDPNSYTTITFKFHNERHAIEFVRNIEKHPNYVSHTLDIPE